MALAATLLIMSVVLFAACAGQEQGPPPVYTLAPPPTPTPPSTAIPLMLVAELGGDTTAFTTTRNAFGLSARNLNTLQRRTFAVGNSFFRRIG